MSMMASMPPLPVVNDAIALLAALADPAKVTALLDELKERAANAQMTLDAARMAQADARETSAAALQIKQEMEVERSNLDMSLAAFRKKHMEQNATFEDMNAALAAQKDNLDARESKLSEWAEELGRREQSLQNGVVDFKTVRDALDAREQHLNAIADIIRPVAEKLGVAL